MAGEKSFAVRLAKRARLADADTEDTLERATAAIEQDAGVMVEIPGPCPSRAGTAFMVAHSYGKRPDWVAMVDAGDQGGIIYATATDKLSWTASGVKVRCTVANEVGLVIRLTVRP
jgi:hypothetical protein